MRSFVRAAAVAFRIVPHLASDVARRGEIAGVLSVRDIVRCWTRDGATSDMPEGRQRLTAPEGAATG